MILFYKTTVGSWQKYKWHKVKIRWERMNEEDTTSRLQVLSGITYKNNTYNKGSVWNCAVCGEFCGQHLSTRLNAMSTFVQFDMLLVASGVQIVRFTQWIDCRLGVTPFLHQVLPHSDARISFTNQHVGTCEHPSTINACVHLNYSHRTEKKKVH